MHLQGNNLGAPPVTVTPAVAGVVNYYIEITSNPPVVCVNPVKGSNTGYC
ncbi:MAG: hypothetical protein IPJ31_16530 [Bacteroidetes bacterium]|nr:hypothetical protein [Bacteroidota bacterium]